MRLDSFGYGWIIQRLPNSYSLTVAVNPDLYKTSRCFGSRQESLIEALLEAYLQALELGKVVLLKKKEVVYDR